MYKNNYFILTGAMGGGKSTVLELLSMPCVSCVPEPARQILYEQRLISSNGVPEKDPNLFNRLMLSRATKFYMDNLSEKTGICIFDRGIPDLIAYAELFRIDAKIYRNAAKEYRYNKNVFFFKGWEEIYTTDDERKMPYRQANEFGERTIEIYEELEYKIIEVPLISSEERAAFILNKIRKQA
jgi:predicted ATPase